MKKAVVTLISLVVLVGLFSVFFVSDAAAVDFTFTAAFPAGAKEGETFTISVNLSTKQTINGYMFTIQTDDSAVALISELNEGVQGEMLTKATMRSVNRDTSDNRKIVVTAGTLMETQGYTGSGTVVTLQYRAKKTLSATELQNAFTFTPTPANILKWVSGKSLGQPATHTFVYDIPKADLTELNQAIAKAEALKKTDYTFTSYRAMLSALEEAKVYQTGTHYADEQATISAKTKALSDKIQALKKTYATALEAAIQKAEGLAKKDYTPASYAKLSEAIANGKAEKKKADAWNTTDENILAATSAIETAISNLQKSEYKKLEELVATAKTIVRDEYTETSFNEFSDALSDAQQLLKNTSAAENDCTAAAETLSELMKKLRFRLADSIDEVKTYLDTSKYSTASLKTLRNAIAAAEKVLASSSAKKADRDKQITALKKAISGLEQSPAIPLRAKIEEANMLSAKDYSATSFKKLTDAIATAEERLKNGASDDLLNASIKAISNAINALEEAPRAALTRRLAEIAGKYSEKDYSTDSYRAFAEAEAAAKERIADENAKDSDLLKALSNLNLAIDNLAPKPSGILKELLAQAEAYPENRYSKDSFLALTQAIQNAKRLLEDEQASDADLESAANEIRNAIDNLQTFLLDVIAEAEAYDAAIYTEKSYRPLSDALAKAKKMLTDPTVEDEQRFEIAQTIRDAIEALVLTEREQLRRTLEQAEATDLSDKTNASIKIFREALLRAKAVFGDDTATGLAIKEACDALRAAWNGLELSVRKTLKTEWQDAQTIPLERYTEESGAALTKAMENAEAVLRKEDATEEEYEDALKSLREAVSGLTEPVKNASPDIHALLFVIGAESVIILCCFVFIGILLRKKSRERSE